MVTSLVTSLVASLVTSLVASLLSSLFTSLLTCLVTCLVTSLVTSLVAHFDPAARMRQRRWERGGWAACAGAEGVTGETKGGEEQGRESKVKIEGGREKQSESKREGGME